MYIVMIKLMTAQKLSGICPSLSFKSLAELCFVFNSKYSVHVNMNGNSSLFFFFIQKQSLLAAENSVFSSYLQFLEKGKTWYKMWVTIPKTEPLVLYLQGITQVK